MKVVTNQACALAISPRDIARFTSGESIGVGDKGMTEDNLKRLVELKMADFACDSPIKASEIAVIVDSESVVIDDSYAFESFTDKDELELYAFDVYNVELDKRKSLKKMIAELKETIEKELNNDK